MGKSAAQEVSQGLLGAFERGDMDNIISIEEAVETNNRRETLTALRGKIAKALDGTESARDIAALSKRLLEVMQELDALPDPSARKSAFASALEKRAAND